MSIGVAGALANATHNANTATINLKKRSKRQRTKTAFSVSPFLTTAVPRRFLAALESSRTYTPGPVCFAPKAAKKGNEEAEESSRERGRKAKKKSRGVKKE
jgi:hypothetical protein